MAEQSKHPVLDKNKNFAFVKLCVRPETDCEVQADGTMCDDGEESEPKNTVHFRRRRRTGVCECERELGTYYAFFIMIALSAQFGQGRHRRNKQFASILFFLPACFTIHMIYPRDTNMVIMHARAHDAHLRAHTNDSLT
jgi:hypothetical protein